ncbi:hypothetical protein GLYMA_17G077400v4 [Glycine max]|uniref:Uncharacterized protein n=2 Tax=Glycine subgen. Soja TaxID=1462606 RepID=K7MKH3_SOYBN|nr:uncharacterized protein LOC100806232 isoform X2 [Glycine max]XP_028210563.1 uncharacterized protein LOC114393414 isoform X2 [Glycine soja]KAH1117354.1 hypothetical protein GYH30_046581 [Glycine max]KRH03115.1 hypothetical protein GLYMA_17G077400v4 [Glycine max]RZB55788.1 hypothetical protein D0Y65_045186 [Glycine soja]|eukprot:XP_006600574.1 uncharacterized protein LOC100806232 isoform X2 [Glycine max]
MPGNEVGDRVHNFFGQENLPQGQYHSQAVDGNWPGLSNNLWAGSQRPTVAPFISNLKNFNLQQSDFEQGHTSTPHLRHGLNLAQSNLRPDSGRNQLPNQQTTVNGYIQGHQVFQSRQNEANILGMDTETDLHGMPNLSRGISVLDSQQGSGLEHYKKNLTRSDASESPVNYDFFGSQQQMSGRHSGMLQSFPRQQSGMNDMQLLQQQAMLNQMQELQRLQQFHQLEARQQSSMNPASSISKQTIASHSASLINGIPINEASNLVWQQPEVVATNANWLQHGGSAVMQGSSNGLVLSPEQLRLMGLVPNQGDQSLYGLPISGSRGTPNLYSHVQADKPAVSQVSIQHQHQHQHQHQYSCIEGDKPTLPHISASGHSFPVHQYGSILDQTNTNDGTSVSRQDIQGKSMFGSLAQGINNGLNMENLQLVNSEQRKVPIEDFNGRQELAGSSDTSQDKVVAQVPPSQNVATLDPTEEKILFGSDDSLWDGLGWSAGFNMLDSTDSFGGVPSVQSGSWSALMQSAVAETSSSEMGIQEEWSGLSVRNTERSSGSERPSTMDSTKQQSGWADNNLQSAPNRNSRPFLRPDDLSRPSTTVTYSGLPGFHQSGSDTAQEQQDRLQTGSSQRSIPQFLESGKWLDCSPQQKPIAEGSHSYGNAANSLEVNEKVISGSWAHQQMLSSPNNRGEPFNRSNGWNAIKSPTPSNNSSMKIRENENVLQPHHDKAMQEDLGQVPAIWEVDSDTNSSVGLEHAKSPGNMQVCGEDSGMNGIAAIPNSGSTWVSRQSSQQLPNADVWRQTDTVGSQRRNESAGKYKHHMEKNPLVLESLKNEKSEGEAHGMENSNKKDKSATGGLRENPSFDGDLRSPKLSGQGNRRPPVTRKFQYHPMGDVGVDTEPYGNKHVINSQPMPHQPIGGLKGQDQSYPGQSKYSHSDGNCNETEKGDSKTIDDNASKSTLPGHMLKTLTPFDRSVGNYALNKTASPRVMDTESSDGSAAHHQRNQSSLSQGFALQLAPPTQRHHMASSHATPHVASETGDKGPTWLAASQTFPSQESSHELRNNISGSSGQMFDKTSQYSALGNIQQAFTSGFPFSRIHTQNQNVANLGGQIANTQCDNSTFVDRTASTNQVDEYCERAQTGQSELQSAQDMSQKDSMNQIRAGDPTMKISTLEAGTAPHAPVTSSLQSAPSKVLHNVWTSVSGKQHPNAYKIPSHPQPNNICETTIGPQKPGIEDSEKGNLSEQWVLPESVDAVEETASASQVKEHVKYTPDTSQSGPAATSKDIEDFGRSLRPNNFLHHNFSMLNQVQSMKNMEIDPSNRDVKRFKVSDNVMDKQLVDSISNRGQQSYGYNNIVKDVSDNSSSVPPSDPNLLRFSTKPGDARDTSASSQEVVGYGQRNALNVANNNKVTSVRSEHSVINPQMAPSWFEQYGTFKNGKMLQMYDVRTMTPQKVMEQPLIIRNQSGSLHLANSMEQVNSLSDAGQNSMLTSVANEHLPSQLLLPAAEPDLSSMRPKKRKSSTSELLPWHKELSQGSERVQDISAAELDWAQAANRLVEKVEDDAELVEELPIMKSKRRLVLTTQLMQQLLNPPPAAVLSADVKLHHESVVYSVARLALGDACSSVSWSGNDTLMSPGSKNPLPDKPKASEKIDQYILKVEDFVDRARKLENDMLRLDSRASVLDLRLECQDLERFSVINRFAKFHGRGQNDGAETSSSDATANAQKSCPQKYVTAVPMPRNLPDRVQCLSL